MTIGRAERVGGGVYFWRLKKGDVDVFLVSDFARGGFTEAVILTTLEKFWEIFSSPPRGGQTILKSIVDTLYHRFASR